MAEAAAQRREKGKGSAGGVGQVPVPGGEIALEWLG